MNIIKSGDSFKIFGDSVSTFDRLPSGVYDIEFGKMTGYSLNLREDLKVTEKVYGDVTRRVKKILNSFKNAKRNLGVILCGNKGSGKSMTARLLAQESEYPVIIVEGPTPGLSEFLMSIRQEVIIIFDEFEKNFGKSYSNEDDEDCSSRQTDLLSLFDGLDSGKKLFIITCNRKWDLDEYLLNRPGRFHYLFEYGNPTKEEIGEYLADNLEDSSKVDEVLKYVSIVDFTYDSLRALCFDINLGYSVGETLLDLNIDIEEKFYNVEVTFSNGTIMCSDIHRITPFEDDIASVSLDRKYIIIFNTCDIIVQKDGSLTLPAADVSIEFYNDPKEDEKLPTISSVRLIKEKDDTSAILSAVTALAV